jgi:hypothetical protein
MGSIGGYPALPQNKDKPGWFIYSLDPGATYSDTVVVSNTTNKEWIVDLYPADSIKSSGGGFALKQKSANMVELGSWIKLEKSEIKLKPLESKKVDFTITIPKDLGVGDYSGAILFEKRTPEDEKSNGGVKVNLRTGVRIYQTVPGKILEELEFIKLDIIENDKGEKIVHSEVKNVGNVSSEAKFETIISTLSFSGGIIEKVFNFTLGRGTTFDNNVRIEDLPFIGIVEIDSKIYLTKKDGTNKFIGEKNISFFVIPWIELLILLTIIIFIIMFIIWRKRKYSGKGWVEFIIKEKDTLTGLSKEHNIDWKIVAKVNKIEAPFLLKTGNKILLPPEKNIELNHPEYEDPKPKLHNKVELNISSWKKFVIKKDVNFFDILKGIHHENDFEIIAEKNNINPPYLVISGTELLLPPINLK